MFAAPPSCRHVTKRSGVSTARRGRRGSSRPGRRRPGRPPAQRAGRRGSGRRSGSQPHPLLGQHDRLLAVGRTRIGRQQHDPDERGAEIRRGRAPGVRALRPRVEDRQSPALLVLAAQSPGEHTADRRSRPVSPDCSRGRARRARSASRSHSRGRARRARRPWRRPAPSRSPPSEAPSRPLVRRRAARPRRPTTPRPGRGSKRCRRRRRGCGSRPPAPSLRRGGADPRRARASSRRRPRRGDNAPCAPDRRHRRKNTGVTTDQSPRPGPSS